jgi:RNA polymerase sigma-70 factor (ECF subfamily)
MGDARMNPRRLGQDETGLPDTRDNDQWLFDLRSEGSIQAAAIADLRVKLLSGLRRGLTKWLDANSPELENLAQDATQEGLVRILDRLDSFEGRSRFTTWAYKVTIHIALSKLRRKEWKNVSLDQMLDPDQERGPGLSVISPEVGPEISLEQKETLERMGQILREELTDRQMALIQAAVLQGVPMEAIAQKMGVQRNALYKMMHDARKKLKKRLLLEGLELEDVLASFGEGKTPEGHVVKPRDG